MLPPEIIIKILTYTDYNTIKNYRHFDEKFIDFNLNYLFRKLCLTYPFLRYGNPKISNFNDFEKIWNMGQYEIHFEQYMFYVRNFDVVKKNTLYFLLINNVFHSSITFHAVNNLNDYSIKYFKKLCDQNKDNYYQNYINSIHL